MKIYEDSTEKMPFIGYDFFTKRDTIPFWQNLPITNDYVLGPGDEIIISLWGESNSHISEIINRDGQIFIDNIGILNLGSKTVEDAKKYIISKYSRLYSTLVGSNPKSFMDLTLGELKSINIHTIGYVNIPGVHMVHPFSSIISGLIQSGGIDNRGSLRNVSLIRNKEIVAIIDIYEYLINGKGVDNIRLLDQDIIFVPPRTSTIPITGRVLRPGYYEILKNESLGDLLSFSGGTERWASDRIFVNKNNPKDKSGYIVSMNESSGFVLSEGDSVHVPLEPVVDIYVNVQGQVKNPGKYPFNDKMKFTDLLDATLSKKDKDFFKTMDLDNITIFRKNPISNEPNIILTNAKNNILLKNGDHITISKNKVLSPIEAIIITGEVKKPGAYPVNNLTTLGEILKKSGGYSDNALIGGVEIFRDSVNIAWENDLFILKHGDSLNVVKRTGLVKIDGEVNVPGYISFNKKHSVKDYIKLSGGFTQYADKKSVFIVYPNGTSTPVLTFKSPKVKEGSVIHVNQRTIASEQQQSGIEIFTTLTSQATSVVTTLLSISLLMQQN